MIFEILKNPMYSYLFILTLVIFLVIFLWRKVTILESNFYILEKRVNLMKDTKYVVNPPGQQGGVDTRSTKAIFANMTDKKLERSNMVMNEIFGNISNFTNACSTDKKCDKEDVTITFDTEQIIDELDITKIIEDVDVSDNVNNTDDQIIAPIIEEHIITYDTKEENDFENTSNASEFLFNADEKYTQKKLSKLNMDKLKTICEKMNLSTEGNKNQLIARILE
jgi:hypothetical protein